MEVAEPDVQQLGRYRIERTLGAGGMGIVYLAQDSKLQRPVAIKKLRKDGTSTTAAQRIQSEAQLLAQLNHPNIVQLHDVLEEGDSIALVMEYVEGTTLQQWMRERTPSLQQKLDLLIQICNGLTEAHSLGIIHRDLKPDNILITNNGVAKITDFGIAKSLQQDVDSITREDQVAGTVDAMSPEQLQGYPLDPRSDLFSLGTIAYELLCGSKPFEKGDGGAMALAHRVVSDPHIPPQQAWPNLPEPLAVLLDRLLGKLPEQRPDSAAQVAEALTFLQQHSADTDTREFSATVTQLLRKPPNKRKRLFATLAGLVVLASAGYWGWKEFTRLEPQYIAVLPVEINGEVRGEDNAKALTATMVRQALMNATSQLKASALVSFTPKEGQDFDAQLQALRDKGVTDALFARLECAQVRCEIELQRIGPAESQIKQQTSFAFLADKRQEAEYRIGNSASNLFAKSYQYEIEDQLMASEDYDQYLNIISRLDSKEVSPGDLDTLFTLSSKYPINLSIYRGLTDVSARLFALSGNTNQLESVLERLERAIDMGAPINSIYELQLLLYSFGSYDSQFESLISILEKANYPTAALKNKRARYFYSKGKYEDGLREAREAAALSPSADNLYLIAINQTASGDYPAARSTLLRLTKAYPEHWSSYSLLSVIELESGNLLEAEAAITAIPEALRGWRTKSNLGVVYFLQNKYQEALTAQKEVLIATPDNVSAILEVAETYTMLGESEPATGAFERVVRLTENSNLPDMLRYRAVALANLGEEDKAIAIVMALLKDSPEDTNVKYKAAQIFALANEWRTTNYYVEQLLGQGMSAVWFKLPALQQLCTQPQVSEKVSIAICD